MGISSYVTFLGDCHDVSQQLQQSDILVVPSREEGFGLVAIEGMAAYVPVIASNVGGLAEIIQNGYNGYLFEKENYTELAELILKVMKQDNQELTSNAYKRAFNQFNICRTSEEMRLAYLK